MATIPQAQWDAMCDTVADAMKVHTRPYVTPLVQDVAGVPPAIGTGTFIERDGIEILTCEHVAHHAPFEHDFYDRQELIKLPVRWRSDPDPIDAAIAQVPTSHWTSVDHSAAALPMSRFASQHGPVDNELLFFRGIAGQNVVLQIGHSRFNLTGYCSQEKPGAGNSQIFEIVWNPAGTTISSGTSAEVRAHFQHNNPGGFSGSLVWNTRFIELGRNLSTWSPEDAVVTGLLRRWDFTTKTLLAWRAEHLLAWM